MIEELRALAVFAKTVDTGSFRAAARELGLSPSVVSHHVSQLESRLGVALLYRSTRRLSLTDDGKRLFDSAQIALQVRRARLERHCRALLRTRWPAHDHRAGFLRPQPARRRSRRLCAGASEGALAINFTDEKRDLIRDGIDLAIRVGALKDSALKSKKLFTLRRKLVASPAHLAAQKKPRTPADLATWEWIGLTMRPDSKTMVSRKGATQRIRFTPRVTVDSIDAACRLAIAGLGLATPPSFLAEEEIRSGRLVELLPAWEVEPLGVYAVWPQNAGRESLTMRMLRFLEAREKARA
ncbi:MAG TPA: LysR family transcriptional regulator [Noviherbaspirillum sp.]|nr:LysR family transcriptional regulator [Noviherbaspirillum sp.]